MPDKLIIDDLFLGTAYKRFYHFYSPVYGNHLKAPISFSSLSSAVSSYLGVSIAETHVFYLEDSPSSFMRNHLVTLAKEFIAENEGNSDIEQEIGGHNLCDYIWHAYRVKESALLRRSTVANFHSYALVSIEAAKFVAECDAAVLLGDDPVYEIAKQCPNLVCIRLGNEETRMPTDMKWVDASYIFCEVYEVDP